jgi:hypothetical protein
MSKLRWLLPINEVNLSDIEDYLYSMTGIDASYNEINQARLYLQNKQPMRLQQLTDTDEWVDVEIVRCPSPL